MTDTATTDSLPVELDPNAIADDFDGETEDEDPADETAAEPVEATVEGGS